MMQALHFLKQLALAQMLLAQMLLAQMLLAQMQVQVLLRHQALLIPSI
jgi:hypothetical protein